MDIDLEKFFDRVNHDILMGLVAKRVTDKRILKLIRGFLNAGVLEDGLVSPTEEGTPQGGPLSPLLSNLMLDVLDKELEKTRPSLRALRRRLQHLCAQPAGGRAGDGEHRTFLDQASQAEGQQGRRARSPSRASASSWASASRARRQPQAADRAAGARPVQGASPGTDAAHAGRKPRADRQGAVAST